jgi:hypothetical protein
MIGAGLDEAFWMIIWMGKLVWKIMEALLGAFAAAQKNKEEGYNGPEGGA